MPDYKALRAYLEGQADLGTDGVFLDEPWALAHKGAPAPVYSRAPTLPNPAPGPAPAASSAAPADHGAPRYAQVYSPAEAKGKTPAAAAWTPIAAPVKPSAPEPYESATSLPDFYGALRKDTLYARSATKFAAGLGKDSAPAAMLVLYSPTPADTADGDFWKSEVGVMLGNLFKSVHVPAEDCFVTYFHKTPAARAASPLAAGHLRRMLEREVSLVKPGMVIFFGDKLLRQALEVPGDLNADGGAPGKFAGVRATAFHDPYAMLQDKQLKVITWKIHIPRCGFFNSAL